ncbi:uncharacterized protein [Amphiura filiformis]|uniref:uncharacterized protein n=1 Tax=Amphiura filiformis TaxID=82378 RepID=UPI003B20F3E1
MSTSLGISTSAGTTTDRSYSTYGSTLQAGPSSTTPDVSVFTKPALTNTTTRLWTDMLATSRTSIATDSQSSVAFSVPSEPTTRGKPLITTMTTKRDEATEITDPHTSLGLTTLATAKPTSNNGNIDTDNNIIIISVGVGLFVLFFLVVIILLLWFCNCRCEAKIETNNLAEVNGPDPSLYGSHIMLDTAVYDHSLERRMLPLAKTRRQMSWMSSTTSLLPPDGGGVPYSRQSTMTSSQYDNPGFNAYVGIDRNANMYFAPEPWPTEIDQFTHQTTSSLNSNTIPSPDYDSFETQLDNTQSYDLRVSLLTSPLPSHEIGGQQVPRPNTSAVVSNATHHYRTQLSAPATLYHYKKQ